MVNGLRIITFYKIMFFALNEMKMNITEVENMLPYELEIYQNLLVIEQKRRLEAMNKNRKRRKR